MLIAILAVTERSYLNSLIIESSDILLHLAEEASCPYTPLAPHAIPIPNLRGYKPIVQ